MLSCRDVWPRRSRTSRRCCPSALGGSRGSHLSGVVCRGGSARGGLRQRHYRCRLRSVAYGQTHHRHLHKPRLPHAAAPMLPAAPPPAHARRRDAHLQIIYFGREHCPAQRHDATACPICSWAAPAAARCAPEWRGGGRAKVQLGMGARGQSTPIPGGRGAGRAAYKAGVFGSCGAAGRG